MVARAERGRRRAFAGVGPASAAVVDLAFVDSGGEEGEVSVEGRTRKRRGKCGISGFTRARARVFWEVNG